MAAPAFRSRTQTSGTATGLTGTEPSGAASGDIIIAVAYVEAGGPTFTPPTGWSSAFTASATTIDTGSMTTPDTWWGHAYWIRRGASAPSYVFGFGVSAYCELTLFAYSGAYNTGDPFSFASKAIRNSASANTPLPDVSGTTDTADELLLFYGITYVGGTLTGPTGFTARATAGHDTQTSDKTQAAAGATGTVTGATVSTANSNAASFLFGLRSLAAPSGATTSLPIFRARNRGLRTR